MIIIENYKKEFEDSINNFLNDENNKLNKLDYKIINEIKNLIKDTINYTVPFMPEEYNLNEEKKDKNIDFFKIKTAFQFLYTNYSKESYIDEISNEKLPYIIFTIPNNNKNLENLSKYILKDIDGDLIFLVRKIKDKWEIPIKAIVVNNNKIRDLILFEKLYFDFEISNNESILKKQNIFLKEFLSKKSEIFYSICNSESEIFHSNKEGILILNSFLKNKKKYYLKEKEDVINDNNNNLYLLNNIYKNSIKI